MRGAEAALALALLVVGSAGGAEPPRCATVVGYNDMDQMIAAAVARVRARYPQFCYTLDLKSTRSGPPALIDGRADLAPMGAEMISADLAAYRRRWGDEPLVVRIAHDSLAPAALSSPIGALVAAGNQLKAVTMAALRRAFTQRPPPTWSELGATGAWAARPVHLYTLAPDTAIGSYLLAGPLGAHGFTPAVRVERQSRDVAGLIAADPLGLGLANLNRAGGATRALAIRGDHGEVLRPDAATIRGGRWPMDRHLLIYVRRQPDGGIPPAARALLVMLLSREGQAIVARAPRDYLPLNARELETERGRLGF